MHTGLIFGATPIRTGTLFLATGYPDFFGFFGLPGTPDFLGYLG
jgi:hypothetical protein